jgi:hypothetical protein
MATKIKSYDEVRVDIDLPAGLRRQLARQSVERDMDLHSLILQILGTDVDLTKCDD